MGIHLFKLNALDLSCISANRFDVVEKELRTVIGMFERAGLGLKLKHDVQLTVHLTDQMGKCVDFVCKKYGKKSSAPFNPLRNTVDAKGVTIYHPKCPPLRTSIVLNQDSWTRDDHESVFTRTYLIIHEIEHVLRRARKTDTIQWCNRDKFVY